MFKKNWKEVGKFVAEKPTGPNVGYIKIFNPTCEGCKSSHILKNKSKWIKTNNIRLTKEQKVEIIKKIKGKKWTDLDREILLDGRFRRLFTL